MKMVKKQLILFVKHYLSEKNFTKLSVRNNLNYNVIC